MSKWPGSGDALPMIDDACIPPASEWKDLAVKASGFGEVIQTEIIAHPSVAHMLASDDFQDQLTALMNVRPELVPPNLWKRWKAEISIRRTKKDSAPLTMNIAGHG